MEVPNLQDLDVYCPKDACAEQVFGPDNKQRPQKRRLQFWGYSFMGQAIYKCPVCGGEKRFRERTFGTGIAGI